jgi:dienelactone hydrolase
MPPGFLRNFLIAFALALAPAAIAQQAEPDAPDKRALETVHFASLDGKTNLTAYLGRHPGDAPRPAVVLMHGCSGLRNGDGPIFGLYRAWMRALFAKGYDVLTVDSAGSRGFGQTCTAGPDRITMYRDRPKDAYAALAYLQAQPLVRPGRIGLMGWSQGGAIVLLSINDKSIGRPAALSQDFAAAVAFYPGACSERLQSKPFTEVEPQQWTTAIPLLVLFGEADVWTPLPPLRGFHLGCPGARQSGRAEKLSVGGARFRCAEPAAQGTAGISQRRRPDPHGRHRQASPRRRVSAGAGISGTLVATALTGAALTL